MEDKEKLFVLEDDHLVITHPGLEKCMWNVTRTLLLHGYNVPEEVFEWCRKALASQQTESVVRDFGEKGVAFVSVIHLNGHSIKYWGWLPEKLDTNNASEEIKKIEEKYYNGGSAKNIASVLWRFGYNIL